MIRKYFVIAVLAAFALSASNAFSEVCVAWKTRKRMFLVSSQEAVGRTCKAKIDKVESTSLLHSFRISVPVKTFDSGEAERDAEVSKILLPDETDAITLSSRSFSIDEWKGLLRTEEGILDVKLKIRTGEFTIPLKFTFEEKSKKIKFTWAGTFTDLKITPPTVAGGLVAQVKDELELIAEIDRLELQQFSL